MTNISSGHKRSWEGVDDGLHKRPRDREEPKDWRDVYLKSPGRKPPPGPKDSLERRDSPGRYDRHDSRKFSDSRRRREPEYRRPTDQGRDRERHDRDRDRRREGHARSRSPLRRTTSRAYSLKPKYKPEEEREEGE
jgi:serine/threonine-protein kinase PRP4